MSDFQLICCDCNPHKPFPPHEYDQRGALALTVSCQPVSPTTVQGFLKKGTVQSFQKVSKKWIWIWRFWRFFFNFPIWKEEMLHRCNIGYDFVSTPKTSLEETSNNYKIPDNKLDTSNRCFRFGFPKKSLFFPQLQVQNTGYQHLPKAVVWILRDGVRAALIIDLTSFGRYKNMYLAYTKLYMYNACMHVCMHSHVWMTIWVETCVASMEQEKKNGTWKLKQNETNNLHPQKLTAGTWKWWFPIGISFSKGPFSGSMFVLGGVLYI